MAATTVDEGTPTILRALEGLCRGCGLEYDPVAATQATAAANVETRPLPRLTLAARDLGLRLT